MPDLVAHAAWVLLITFALSFVYEFYRTSTRDSEGQAVVAYVDATFGGSVPICYPNRVRLLGREVVGGRSVGLVRMVVSLRA